MPLPAILGLPALASFLTVSFTALIQWFAARLTKRIAVAIIIIGAFTAALTAMIQKIAEIALNLLANVPNAEYVVIMVPDAIWPCLSALVSTEIILAAFGVWVRYTDFKLKAIT